MVRKTKRNIRRTDTPPCRFKMASPKHEDLLLDVSPSRQTTSILYAIARTIVEYGTLEEYLCSFLDIFADPQKAIVFTKHNGDLEVRVSISVGEESYFHDVPVEGWILQRAKESLFHRRPVSFDCSGNVAIVFNNLNFENNDAQIYPISVPFNEDVFIFAPFYYRDQTEASGVLAIGGRILKDVEPGFNSAFWSAKIVAALASQISYQLVHKFDAITFLKGYNDWRTDLRKALQLNSQGSLILIDLDHFKSINDRYGHDIGNEVLKAVSNILRSIVRTEDNVYRIGGEEFAILLNSDVETAQEVSERIRKTIETTPISIGNYLIHITCSIGISSFVGPFSSLDSAVDAVFKSADQNLYVAKESGRNRVVAPVAQR